MSAGAAAFDAGHGDRGRSPAVVVAGHLCLDIVCRVHRERLRLEPGTLLGVSGTRIAAGGVVANTGLALERLGVATRLVAAVGDDTLGTLLRATLRAGGARDGRRIRTAAGAATSYTLVLTPPSGERIFIHDPGANDRFGIEHVRRLPLRGVRLFHFGYPPLLRRMYRDGGSELVRLLRHVHRRGVSVSLDLSLPDPASAAGRADWPAILRAALAHVDIFVPSLDEALTLVASGRARLTRRQGGAALAPDPERLEELAEALLAMGPAIVGFKLGADGWWLRTAGAARLARMGAAAPAQLEAWADRQLWAPGFVAEVVSTVGAGDASYAGLLASLLRGVPPESAVTMAVAAGAASVEAATAVEGVPAWDVLERRVLGRWGRRALAPEPAGWRSGGAVRVYLGPRDRRRTTRARAAGG